MLIIDMVSTIFEVLVSSHNIYFERLWLADWQLAFESQIPPAKTTGVCQILGVIRAYIFL